MKEVVRQVDVSHQMRKNEHLQICLSQEVQFRDLGTGFGDYYFVHQALPQLNLDQIDITTGFLGKTLAAPLLISPMVGGIPNATGLNRNLAQAAQNLGVAMGVGSQRCLLDLPELLNTFTVRDVAPDILLFANLGAVQLNYGFSVADCLRLVRTIDADGLVLHLNPLQEALQPEGNTNFSGLTSKIKEICENLPVPVIVKEVGVGISEEVATELAAAGVAAIDVSGAGGTSWSQIEGMRTAGHGVNPVAAAFANWGIPTAESITLARKGAPGVPLIASGGIRSGVDAAKALALGADLVGIATPLLKAANRSDYEVEEYLEQVIQELKISMFCTGSANLEALKTTRHLKKR